MARSLLELLDRGSLDEAAIGDIARQLAALHDGLPVAVAPGDWRARVRALRTGPAELGDAGDPELGEALREVLELQTRFLDVHPVWIQARTATGRVRPCRGDLRLETAGLDAAGRLVLPEPGPPGDVAGEVAGLSVDLACRGHSAHAERLLAAYAGHADDYALYRVIDFLERDRACAFAREGRLDARRLLQLARATARRPLLPPAVVALGGLVASGKSTVAAELAARLAAPRIVGDHLREFGMGATPRHRPTAGERLVAFESDFARRLYAKLFEEADAVLVSGRSVVLDCGFPRARERRRAAELAARHGVPFFFVECRVSDAVAARRLAEREARGGDGWHDLARDYRKRWESVGDEVPASHYLVVDTARPVEESVADAARLLPLWPEGHGE